MRISLFILSRWKVASSVIPVPFTTPVQGLRNPCFCVLHVGVDGRAGDVGGLPECDGIGILCVRADGAL